MAGATLVIRILADAKQAQDTMKKASSKGGAFAGVLGKAALPAAALGAGLGMMTKAAADDARGQAILANTLQKTAGATDAQIAATEAWIAQTSAATGVADDQLRPALGALARSTGDVAASQGAMGLALDVAAATGKDVESVANAMSKGFQGNTGALGKLIPGIDKAALKSGDMSAVMADLAKKTGGSAAKAADTAAGKMQRANVAMDELQETAGSALIPVLGTLAGWLQKAARFGQDHEGATKALIIGVGGLAAAILVLNAALKAYQVMAAVVRGVTLLWAAAQGALNLAFLANPIFLVIAIVVALVAAIVIAYQKSETFRKIVQGAWKGIKTAALAVWNFLKTYVFAPFVAFIKKLWDGILSAVAGIKTAWAGLKAGLKTVWDWIKTNVIDPLKAAFKSVSDKVGDIVDLAITAWEGLKTGLKAVWDWIKLHVIDPLQAAFDAVFDVVQKVVDWVKKIKLPGPIQAAVDWITGRSVAPVTPAPPAPAGRGAPAPRSAAGGGRSPASGGGLAVNVYLDGKKVGGYLDRVVTARLDAEGFALAAGAWGS